MKKFILIITLLGCLFLSASPALAQDTDISGSVPLIISNPTHNAITATSVTITWHTNAGSFSRVFYTTATAWQANPGTYAQNTPLDSTLVSNHSVALTGLSASTVYHYRVESVSTAFGTATSGDFTFTTSTSGTGGGGTGGETGGTSGGTGGGGTGGGGAGGTGDRIYITEYQNPPGVFSQDFAIQAWDGIFTLIFSKGTAAKTPDGAMSYLVLNPIAVDKQTLPLPQGGYIIGRTYDAGPSGSTFSPSIIINVLYDETQIPAGVRESDLVVGYWNEIGQKWEILSDSKVDTVKNIISCTTTHFSIFSILGFPPKTSLFTISNLAITPAEALIGQEISISALVANNSDIDGEYDVTLEIDNKPVSSQKVNLAARTSQTVTFTTKPTAAGTYTDSLNGMTRSFKVSSGGIIASFFLSDLKISASKVNIGQKVTISSKVANKGTLPTVYKLNLMLNGKPAMTREIGVAAGSTENVTFTVIPETAGTYAFDLEGLKGTFEVIMPPTLATFTISEIAVTPETLLAGDSVTLSALIKNNGDLPGTYTVTIKMDNRVVQSEVLSLEGKSQKNVSYNLKMETAGTHRVQINESSRQVVVEPSDGNRSWITVGFTIGIVVILLVTFFTVLIGFRKRRYGIYR